MAIVRSLQGWTQHAAAPADALAVLAAVDAVGAWLPCRIACLERSLAAVLLLAGRRRGVAWQVGVRVPPLAMHAWLTSSDGEILGEPESTAAYEPLLVVKPPHDT